MTNSGEATVISVYYQLELEVTALERSYEWIAITKHFLNDEMNKLLIYVEAYVFEIQSK